LSFLVSFSLEADELGESSVRSLVPDLEAEEWTSSSSVELVTCSLLEDSVLPPLLAKRGLAVLIQRL